MYSHAAATIHEPGLTVVQICAGFIYYYRCYHCCYVFAATGAVRWSIVQEEGDSNSVICRHEYFEYKKCRRVTLLHFGFVFAFSPEICRCFYCGGSAEKLKLPLVYVTSEAVVLLVSQYLSRPQPGVSQTEYEVFRSIIL